MTGNVGVIILAAGKSERMGKPKLLLPLRGRPLLSHVLERVTSIKWLKVVVVIGEPQNPLAQICVSYNVDHLHNKNAHLGQSTSVSLGLTAIPHEAEGIIFIPGDQPLLDTELLQSLVREYLVKKDPQAIIVPYHQGKSKSPVLFGASWRLELAAIHGDEGGRQIIRNHPTVVIPLEWANSKSFWDVDTPKDYELLCEEVGGDECR